MPPCRILPQIVRFGLATWGIALLSAVFYFTLCLGMLDSMTALLLHLRAKKVDDTLPVPRFRVAMIATKVPSEPLSMLQATLSAMLAQDYPHPYDVWLADEDPDAATKAWCADNGVRISCRKGVEAYHRLSWPRRTRCKEGNLAYFYDHFGYDRYDIVAQSDADHVPSPSYLSTLLPAFLDDAVGYAAMPSICGANEKDHGWVVRMRLFLESLMHGSQGAAMSAGWLPCCIGSHYAVRTRHLKAVGGIGPELDEDMSTSIIMSAAGYKGVFSMNTIAHGDGPACFEDCMFQEYQWARSGVLLFLRDLPPSFRRGGWRVRFRMAHIVLSWLVTFFIQAATPFLLLAVALATRGGDVSGPAAAGIGYLVPALASPCQPGLLYGLQLLGGGVMFLSFISANGWLRPVDTPVISWECMLHQFCRPFAAAKGMLHALFSHFTGRQLSIKVTPKGPQGERFLPPSAVAPHAAAAAALAAAGLVSPSMVLLCAPGALLHCGVAVLLVALHYRDHHSFCRLPAHNFLALLVPIATAVGCTYALLRAHGSALLSFASEFVACAGHQGLRRDRPLTTAYTAAVLGAAAVALSLSRRAFFTPLRTHRCSLASPKP
ncbi:hypothetical protein ABPG75_004949 [Micractinium tetrahymenae]